MIPIGNRLGYKIVRPRTPADGGVYGTDLKYAYGRGHYYDEKARKEQYQSGKGGIDRDPATRLDNAIVGAIAEVGFSRFLGVPLPVGDDFGVRGDVAGHEVRGTRYVPPALIVTAKDLRQNPHRIAVAVGLDVVKPLPEFTPGLCVRYWVGGYRVVNTCQTAWYKRLAEANLPQENEVEQWLVPPADLLPWESPQFALFDE